MKNILFVNCCMRGESRTLRLAGRYLETLNGNIKELRLTDTDIAPFNEATLAARDADTSRGNLTREKYPLAYEFADADEIVIAAPFWDMSFPSLLKVYFENISVCGITFAYNDDGTIKKLTRAEKLTYIATCGGFLPENSSLKKYITELSGLFGIGLVEFHIAEGLDIYGNDAEKILKNAADKIRLGKKRRNFVK